MKKILSIMLAIMLVFGVCACESKDKSDKEQLLHEITANEFISTLESITGDDIEYKKSSFSSDKKEEYNIHLKNFDNNDEYVFDNITFTVDDNSNVTSVFMHYSYTVNPGDDVYYLNPLKMAISAVIFHAASEGINNISTISDSGDIVPMFIPENKEKPLVKEWKNISYIISYSHSFMTIYFKMPIKDNKKASKSEVTVFDTKNREIEYFDFTADELIDDLAGTASILDNMNILTDVEFESDGAGQEFTRYLITTERTPSGNVNILEFYSNEIDGRISHIYLKTLYYLSEDSKEYYPDITIQRWFTGIVEEVSKTNYDESLDFVWDWWKPEAYSGKYENISDETWKNINYNVTYNNDKKSIKISLFPSKE